MKKLLFTLLAVGMLGHISAQNPFLRHLALSPDGKSIAFSYQGDIWYWQGLEGNPVRLTLHEAYEANPIFSPDGKQIAFNSTRFGGNDIFISDLSAQKVKRLSYHSAGDNLSDWSKDLGILFSTERAYNRVEWDPEIHHFENGSNTPQRLLGALGEMAVVSPNGRYIAFTRGACRVTRENYVGPADNEVWIYDTQKKTYSALTDNDINDIYPQWINDNELVYLSSKDGRYNLKKSSLEGTSSWLSSFSDEGIHHFSIAKGKVAFNRGSKSYIAELSKVANAKELNPELPGDYRFYPTERKNYRNAISDYSLSPNGKLVALEIHGEIFVKEIDEDESRTRNLSNHPFFDREPTFINDSTIIFSSDREDDTYNFYQVNSSDSRKTGLYESLRHELRTYRSSKSDLRGAKVSPDGKRIAWLENDQKLMVGDLNDKGQISNATSLVDAWHGASGIAWSPDSRYLAYHRDDLNFNTEVFIQEAAKGSEAVNISMHPGSDYGAVWSPDGSKLAFISDRNNDDQDIWFLWLKREDWLKSEEERKYGYYFEQEKGKEKEEDKSKDKDSKDDKKKDTKVDPIVIDFENIHMRLQQVTSYTGNESNVLVDKDGETFYFTRYDAINRGSDLYKIKYDGTDVEALTKGGTSPYNMQWDKDQKGLYFISRGTLKYIKTSGGKTTSYKHEAKMIIDKVAERKQVYAEASRLIRDRFYDPEFHGQNWNELNKYYRDWAISASTEEDFSFVYNLMLGRLNASHMGLYGGTEAEINRERTGRLGIEVRPNAKGVLVSRIIPNSPADRSVNNLRVGDRILSVNGTAVDGEINFYSTLAETSNEVQILEIERNGSTMEIAILPSRSVINELYEEWVATRKAMVDRYSKGKLGYIHIKGMDKPSFERFERELMASGYGKEGIVIDVRFNGGGWTTDYLMAVLSVRQHAYTIPRGASKSLRDNKKFSNYYPYSERLPLAAWTKPSIALCNESSYSNAEIFSHAYKSLGIGTLVGKPTFGAVISTGGSRLLNGSFIRLPFRAWYVKNSGMNMENGPAVPDILLDNPANVRELDDDAQLKRAVEELLNQIENQD